MPLPRALGGMPPSSNPYEALRSLAQLLSSAIGVPLPLTLSVPLLLSAATVSADVEGVGQEGAGEGEGGTHEQGRRVRQQRRLHVLLKAGRGIGANAAAAILHSAAAALSPSRIVGTSFQWDFSPASLVAKAEESSQPSDMWQHEGETLSAGGLLMANRGAL